MKSFIDNDNEILLSTCKDENRKIIKSSELIEIIEARLEEIFSLINKDIINTYGETVIGICAIIIVMMLVGMSMAAYRNILLNVISSCLG